MHHPRQLSGIILSRNDRDATSILLPQHNLLINIANLQRHQRFKMFEPLCLSQLLKIFSRQRFQHIGDAPIDLVDNLLPKQLDL